MYVYVVLLTVCIVYILDYKYTLALYSHHWHCTAGMTHLKMFRVLMNSQQFQKWNILTQKCCEITVVTPHGLGDVHRRYRGRCRLSFHWRFLTKLQQVRILQTVRCRIPEHFYIYRNFHRFATKHSLCATWCQCLTSIDYFVSQSWHLNYVAQIVLTWTYSVSVLASRVQPTYCVIAWEQTL
jgi:hypothetical protein